MTPVAGAVATGHPRRMRRDAAANQERVLAAAVTAMLRDGRQVPMSVIADEAGVGVATLYRKFADRDALLTALTARAFDLLTGHVDEAHEAGGAGVDQLDRYWDVLIDEHDQLVLPLGGGPPISTPERSSGPS